MERLLPQSWMHHLKGAATRASLRLAQAIFSTSAIIWLQCMSRNFRRISLVVTHIILYNLASVLWNFSSVRPLIDRFYVGQTCAAELNFALEVCAFCTFTVLLVHELWSGCPENLLALLVLVSLAVEDYVFIIGQLVCLSLKFIWLPRIISINIFSAPALNISCFSVGIVLSVHVLFAEWTSGAGAGAVQQVEVVEYVDQVKKERNKKDQEGLARSSRSNLVGLVQGRETLLPHLLNVQFFVTLQTSSCNCVLNCCFVCMQSLFFSCVSIWLQS